MEELYHAIEKKITEAGGEMIDAPVSGGEPKAVDGTVSFMCGGKEEVFEKVKGIWLGNYTHESGIKLEKILLDTIGDEFKGPIIHSENFGHIENKTVIPIGTRARIDTNQEVKIKLLEKCVK